LKRTIFTQNITKKRQEKKHNELNVEFLSRKTELVLPQNYCLQLKK